MVRFSRIKPLVLVNSELEVEWSKARTARLNDYFFLSLVSPSRIISIRLKEPPDVRATVRRAEMHPEGDQLVERKKTSPLGSVQKGLPSPAPRRGAD